MRTTQVVGLAELRFEHESVLSKSTLLQYRSRLLYVLVQDLQLDAAERQLIRPADPDVMRVNDPSEYALGLQSAVGDVRLQNSGEGGSR
jgi:hypothetical protein